MLRRNQPDHIHVAFDDHRLVANAGLILPATLSLHLRPCDGQTGTSSQVVSDISAQRISVLDCLPHTKSIADGQ